MIEVRVIKTMCHFNGYDAEPSANPNHDIDSYVPWVSDSPMVLLDDDNGFIYQFMVDGRQFVAHYDHWEQYKSEGEKWIYATEVYR